MHIIELKAENIKRIKAVEIKPTETMVVLEGKNEQGKTSVLDCIAYALGGKKLIPDNPIRNGEDKASVELLIGDYKISRTWTQKGTYLKMENKEGFKSANPQKMLDAIIGNLSFDPMEFCNYSEKKRIDVLKDICKLNFDEINQDYKTAYDERTFKNRRLKELNVKISSYPTTETVKDLQSVDELRAEIKLAEKNNEEIMFFEQKNDSYKKTILANELKGKELLYKIGALKEENDLSLLNIENNNKELKTRQRIDTKSFDSLMDSIIENEKNKARCAEHDKLKIEKLGTQNTTHGLDVEIETLTQKKKEMIQNAKMPIDGLGFETNDITYNGIDFESISMAQKIKVSMSMAMALNPKIKIIRILNGSLLDSEAMKEIELIAKEKNFQIWVEKVADEKTGNAIYIEDGEIK